MVDKPPVVRSKIVGQEGVRTKLSHALQAGTAAHAYIFSGQHGIGKAGIALEFARLILCDYDLDEPCETCEQCQLSRMLQHPDLSLIFPLPTGKSKDDDRDPADEFSEEISQTVAALAQDPYAPTLPGFAKIKDSGGSQKIKLREDEIKIAQIRAMLRKVWRKPFQARRKVFIIFHADAMNISAQNAFLKALEEPPSDGYFLLVTENERDLLPTIRSRGCVLRLPPLEAPEITRALVQNGVAAKTAEIAAALAAGSFARARELASRDLPALQESVVNFMAESAKCNPFTLTDTIDAVSEILGSSDRSYFDFLSLFLRDAATFAYMGGQTTQDLTFHELRHRISKVASSYPEADFSSALKAIDTASVRLSAGYTPDLVLTALAICIHRALGTRARAS